MSKPWREGGVLCDSKEKIAIFFHLNSFGCVFSYTDKADIRRTGTEEVLNTQSRNYALTKIRIFILRSLFF